MSGEVEQVLAPMLLKRWVSPGPTMDALVKSMVLDPARPTRRRERVATGPVGSGKTTGIMGATIISAMNQPKWPDGIIRYRLLALRDTYRNLHTQLIDQFWATWWPRKTPGIEWSGEGGGPVDCMLRLESPVGPIDYLVQFRALGDARTETEIENLLRGLEFTDALLEEGDLLPESVRLKIITRMGRFPPRSVDDVGARGPTLFIGSNAFLIGTWAYNTKMTGIWRPGIELFEQPSGRGPDAENLHNLSEGYYEAIVEKSDERTVRRMVDNEHVLPLAGTPVYPEFRDLVHVRPVVLDRNLPLRIGFDGGLQTLNPAAALGQRGMARQLRIKGEIAVTHGCGVEQFGELVNAELGKPQYAPWSGSRKEIICRVDPSAQWGNDKKAGQPNWIVALERRTGLRIKPARTNDLAPRRAALREPMKRMVDGHPGLVVDPEAVTVRMSLGGLFHYPKIRSGMGSRDSDTPAKNHPHSDVAEACEYLAMDDEAYGEFEGRAQGTKPRRPVGKLEYAETD